MKRDLFKEIMVGFEALASDRDKKPKKKAGGVIRLNDTWSVGRDKYQWVLYESLPAKKKDGTPFIKVKERYYPWMSQALVSAADKGCEGKTTFDGVVESYIDMQDLIRLHTSDFDKEHARLRGEIAILEKSLRNAKTQLKRLRAQLGEKA